eukprot:CAMPEP_0184644266 /NCGR_PEP_ID=MMETSP0308-20130426/1020_1 /TAXON_ID=38269 /ORGANISM="Gloeochaete witrockiana, Strain SAG 46.84" /LENGTH=214 /DNA_ID=CAMNT_0027072713 /DNA_START=109 /DNA_END=753 /DNA_ORIENTATION=-
MGMGAAGMPRSPLRSPTFGFDPSDMPEPIYDGPTDSESLLRELKNRMREGEDMRYLLKENEERSRNAARRIEDQQREIEKLRSIVEEAIQSDSKQREVDNLKRLLRERESAHQQLATQRSLLEVSLQQTSKELDELRLAVQNKELLLQQKSGEVEQLAEKLKRANLGSAGSSGSQQPSVFVRKNLLAVASELSELHDRLGTAIAVIQESCTDPQ